MKEIVYCGLKLYTECSYFKFTEGDHASIVTNSKEYAVEIIYPKGITSKGLANLLKLEYVDDLEIKPTKGSGFIFITDTYLSLNGLRLRKATFEPHVFRSILVDDFPSRVAQDYNNTTIVLNVNECKNDPELLKYIFSNLKYFKLDLKNKVDFDKYTLFNYPKILIENKSISLESSNCYINKLRSKHDIYLIKAIDYEHEFFRRLSNIAEDFGIQITRYNREETLRQTSYISYSINQTPNKYIHARYSDFQDQIMCHTLGIDFTLKTPDMVLLFDFKNRYNNVDLFTNFSQFKVKDKYGEEWIAAVKWGTITDEFNHIYSQDDNSNFSHQCNFRADLYFYEVYDKNYNYIDEIITQLQHIGLWESEGNYDPDISGRTEEVTTLK